MYVRIYLKLFILVPEAHDDCFFVNYLFGEAGVAYNFLLLEDGCKFLDDRSVCKGFTSNSLA